MVYPPTHPMTRRSRSPSSCSRSQSPSPPTFIPSGGQPTIINIPGQPGPIGPAVPMAPSTQPPFNVHPDLPGLILPVQTVLTPSGHPEFDKRRKGQGQPIIIHPPGPPVVSGPLSPLFPPVHPGMIIGAPPCSPSPSRSYMRSQSHTPPSPRPSFFAPPFPPPGVGTVPMPMPMPMPGMQPTLIPVPGPSLGRRLLEYSPTRSLRPSYAPTHHSEHVELVPGLPALGFQPVPTMQPAPTAIHIEPMQYTRSC
jgi:hypothetical protein